MVQDWRCPDYSPRSSRPVSSRTAQSGFPKNCSRILAEQRFVCSRWITGRAVATADRAAIAPARLKFSLFPRAVAVRSRAAARDAAPFLGRNPRSDYSRKSRRCAPRTDGAQFLATSFRGQLLVSTVVFRNDASVLQRHRIWLHNHQANADKENRWSEARIRKGQDSAR